MQRSNTLLTFILLSVPKHFNLSQNVQSLGARTSEATISL